MIEHPKTIPVACSECDQEIEVTAASSRRKARWLEFEMSSCGISYPPRLTGRGKTVRLWPAGRLGKIRNSK